MYLKTEIQDIFWILTPSFVTYFIIFVLFCPIFWGKMSYICPIFREKMSYNPIILSCPIT